MRFSPFYMLAVIALLVSTYSVAKSVNVMGPLWLSSEKDWSQFRADLNLIKSSGASAISIDVWWGAVEKSGDQQFDWTYYDKVFTLITEAELNIVPIMSFHQCGGNVGDRCDVPIPNWIWAHFKDTEATSLMYKSEQGNYSKEYVSLWADDLVVPQYKEFMHEFATQFRHIAHRFEEINISMGPAGELRYPSYNQHDSETNYPTRGAFQSYGNNAKRDFQRHLISTYPTLSSLNKKWQTNYKDYSEITMPADMEQFINSGGLLNTHLGRDFLSWYHQSLVAHANRKLAVAHQIFIDTYKTVDIGYKVAGLHWLMASPNNDYRAAEFASGVVSVEEILAKDSSLGYGKIVKLAAKYSNNIRKTVMHFTCLEMANTPTAPSYSLAKDLVSAIGEEAHRHNVVLKGENALAAGILTTAGWENIEDAFASGHYDGLTLLRLEVATKELPMKKIRALSQQKE